MLASNHPVPKLKKDNNLKRPISMLFDSWLKTEDWKWFCFQASPSKRLSERFLNRIGARTVEPSNVRDRDPIPVRRGFDSRRLGDRLPFRGHDSGDDLERDNGEDLRSELDGKHAAANMLIQITRSPEREEVSIFYFFSHTFQFFFCYNSNFLEL